MSTRNTTPLPTAERLGRPIVAFSNTYARLPPHFFARVDPAPVATPRLIAFNDALASELGFNAEGLRPDELAAVLAGNVAPQGAEPIAMAYAGHQFGNFVPQLGDGRAILLGEVLDRNGRRRDIQLKGAGRTPFSRRGDGRAALGPVLRESRLPGAVLTRVASSQIRVGTFQYFAARRDTEAVERLSDHVIDATSPRPETPGGSASRCSRPSWNDKLG
jgi:uncharacterized protein YdiU (UPF0061 family)